MKAACLDGVTKWLAEMSSNELPDLRRHTPPSLVSLTRPLWKVYFVVGFNVKKLRGLRFGVIAF